MCTSVVNAPLSGAACLMPPQNVADITIDVFKAEIIDHWRAGGLLLAWRKVKREDDNENTKLR
jgi:hypothetical protein